MTFQEKLQETIIDLAYAQDADEIESCVKGIVELACRKVVENFRAVAFERYYDDGDDFEYILNHIQYEDVKPYE